MKRQHEQDALDALYNAVERLQVHGCDLDYIKAEVETAYQFQSERTPRKEAGSRGGSHEKRMQQNAVNQKPL